MLERGEALGQSLAVVEPIHTDDQFAAEQARRQSCHLVFAHRIGRFFDDRANVDANRVRVDMCRALRPRDAGLERLHVITRLESGDVVLAQIPHDLGVVREQLEHLNVRKRRVQKETDRPVELVLAQVTRHRNEVIVVHPHRITGPQHLHQLLREQRVDGLVGLVMPLLMAEHVREVVKQRPERAVAVSVVVVLDLRWREVDGGVLDVSVSDDLRVIGRALGTFAAPAEPHAP